MASVSAFPAGQCVQRQSQFARRPVNASKAVAVHAGPKGFGAKPKVESKPRISESSIAPKEQVTSSLPGRVVEEDEDDEDVVPEAVTNRILQRLVLTVGAPLLVGLSFFPLFYYLKVVQKVSLPEWLPLLTSSTLFGLAGLGISYGVLSASWDPTREGTLLGWKEFRQNWPIFMQTMRRERK